MSSFSKKFEDFPEGMMTWLESILAETESKISKSEWRNKNDEKICYTHRPENSDDYTLTITVVSESENNIEFVSYLIENKRKTINYLKNCYTE